MVLLQSDETECPTVNEWQESSQIVGRDSYFKSKYNADIRTVECLEVQEVGFFMFSTRSHTVFKCGFWNIILRGQTQLFLLIKKTQHITIFLGHRFFLSLIRACKTLWFCERNKIPNFKQEMCNDFSKLWFSHKIRKNIPYTIPSPLTLLQKSWKLSLTHVFYLLPKQPTRSNSVPERFF